MRVCPQCATQYANDELYCANDGAQTQDVVDAGAQVHADPLIGRVIEKRYRVERQIGEGGMGVVYLATHTTLGKKSALKVLRGDMARDPDVVQRFMNEAQSATQIGHENIVDISDFGKLPDGSAFFVMEYLDGEALTDLIKRGGSVPLQDALRIVRQIASALGAAHARGIVHRDMKPDNIYLVRRGDNEHFVKVLDFGIAKVGGASSKLTKTGMVFGTPHYMSPEQAAGQAVDARTDIYALGVIMYEMFTGRVPFDADTFMGVLTKHMFEQPEPPSRKNDRLGAVEDVILKALSKKPEQRYQKMDELIADLDRIVSGGASVQLGGNAGIHVPNLADVLEPPTRTEMNLGSVKRGAGAGRWIMIGGVALVLVGVGAWAAMRGGGTTASPTTEPAANAEATTPLPPQTPAVPVVDDGPNAEQRGVVRVVSQPSGAQVLQGGAVIGNTPFETRRPTGDPMPLSLRMPGYSESIVAILRDSPDEVTVVLTAAEPAAPTEPTKEASATKRRGGPRAAGTSPTPAADPFATPAPRPRSEIADPWEN